MVGWHHWLSGHEYEQARGDTEGQRSLACCSPWDRRVAHDLVPQQQQDCRNKNLTVWSRTISKEKLPLIPCSLPAAPCPLQNQTSQVSVSFHFLPHTCLYLRCADAAGQGHCQPLGEKIPCFLKKKKRKKEILLYLLLAALGLSFSKWDLYYCGVWASL